MKDFPEVMGRKDVAAFLKVTTQYVDHLVRVEKLRSRQTSAGLIFLKSDVEALQAQRGTKAKATRRAKRV